MWYVSRHRAASSRFPASARRRWGTRPGGVRKCTGDFRFLPTAASVLLGWPHQSFARGLVKFTMFVLTGSPCDVWRQPRRARNRCRESRTKGESERGAPVQSEDLRYAPWRRGTTCAVCWGCGILELPYRSPAATSLQPSAEVHGPSPHSSRCLPKLHHVTMCSLCPRGGCLQGEVPV